MKAVFAFSTAIMVIFGVYLLAHGLCFLITDSSILPPVLNTITAFISLIWGFACAFALLEDSPNQQ